jgi:hypothetical protein
MNKQNLTYLSFSSLPIVFFIPQLHFHFLLVLSNESPYYFLIFLLFSVQLWVSFFWTISLFPWAVFNLNLTIYCIRIQTHRDPGIKHDRSIISGSGTVNMNECAYIICYFSWRINKDILFICSSIFKLASPFICRLLPVSSRYSTFPIFLIPLRRPTQREGMGLPEYQAMHSLRDVSHDGWLCTFTIQYNSSWKHQIEAGQFLSGQPVRYVKDRGLRRVHHVSFTPSKVVFNNLANFLSISSNQT